MADLSTASDVSRRVFLPLGGMTLLTGHAAQGSPAAAQAAQAAPSAQLPGPGSGAGTPTLPA